MTECGWGGEWRLIGTQTILSIGRLSLYLGFMLLIVGTLRLPAENMEAARPAMKRMADASRAEEGCVEYTYAEDVFEPGLIHVKELWIDQAALDRHFATEHLADWRQAWPSLSIGERNLRVYEVGEPRTT